MVDRIDLNTATVRDVAALPGMDHMLARRIVLHRKLYGSFRSLEDVTQVDGVSPRLLAFLAERIEVDAPEEGLPVGRLRFGDADEPVVFVGPPHLLRGALALRNEGDATVFVPELRVENTDLRAAGGTPLRRLVVGASLHPEEQRRTMLKVRIDPTMPPGEYTAELVAGHHRLQATFFVTEHLATIISPSDITLSTVAGKSEHRLMVHNGGNLPLTIGHVGALVLEDPDVQCRTIRETIHKAHDHPTWDELVGTASDELKKNYANLEPLRVRTKNKPVHISPGGQALVVLEAHVPKNLPRRRNFVAKILIYDASLTFELMSGLQPVDDET